MYDALLHILSSVATVFNVSLKKMHLLFLNNYQTKQIRVLEESPFQDQTNHTLSKSIRRLYNEFFLN